MGSGASWPLPAQVSATSTSLDFVATPWLSFCFLLWSLFCRCWLQAGRSQAELTSPAGFTVRMLQITEWGVLGSYPEPHPCSARHSPDCKSHKACK